MDYILEDVVTGRKIMITKDQKDLLDSLADIEYSSVDTKIYVINKSKYFVSVCR